jgi:hypothetical protein
VVRGQWWDGVGLSRRSGREQHGEAAIAEFIRGPAPA